MNTNGREPKRIQVKFNESGESRLNLTKAAGASKI